MCGEKGACGEGAREGMMRQARTKCCNVAMQHAKGDAIEATHDEGAMRQRRRMRGVMRQGQRDRARAKAAHDEGQRVAKGRRVARGRRGREQERM